jgi:hypothetical protein
VTLVPIGKAVGAWDRFWFTPDSATNLAFVRVVVAAHALWILLSHDYASISGLPDFWATVPASLRWRYLLFEGHPYFERAVQGGATLALLAALVGVYPRVACFTAGVLLYHLAPLESIYWSPTPFGRGLTLAPVLLVLLGAARSGDAYRLWPRAPRPASEPSLVYGWPRRLTWLLVAQIYLFSAYAKLVTAGPAWSAGDSIRRWFLLYGVDDRWRFQDLALWLADRPMLCGAIGIGTVVFEWAFILAVFRRDARRFLVPLGLLLQVGILLAMSIHVGETWLLVTFLDWDWLSGRIRRWRRGAALRPAPASS